MPQRNTRVDGERMWRPYAPLWWRWRCSGFLQFARSLAVMQHQPTSFALTGIWRLWSVFVEGGKPETWRKILGAREILTTNSAHIWYLAGTQPTSETWPELSPHLIPGRNSAHIWNLAGTQPTSDTLPELSPHLKPGRNSAHIWYLAWTQPTSETWPELSPHLIPGRNRTWATMVGGELSHLISAWPRRDEQWPYSRFCFLYAMIWFLFFLFLCVPFFIWEACYDSYPAVIRSMR